MTATLPVTSAAPPAPGPRRWWRAPWVRALVSVGVVAVIFGFFFPKVADYGAVWSTIAEMTPLELGTLLLAAIWNLVSYWPVLTGVQPGLRLREAAVANLASTAVANTVPGGGAVGVGVTMTMQRSWGLPVSGTALATLVSGVWNNFVKLGLPVVALGLLAVRGNTGPGLTLAAFVGVGVLIGAVVLFALLLRSDVMARRLGRGAARLASAVGRPFGRDRDRAWDQKAAGLRSDVIELLSERWVRITVTAVVSHLSLFAVLLLALRHVGVSEAEVPWPEVLAAFAFVRLLSAIPVTPGGLGLVELGLTAALGTGLPESTRNQVAAAVLVYRALTWLLPIPLGVGCWAFWRTSRAWRR